MVPVFSHTHTHRQGVYIFKMLAKTHKHSRTAKLKHKSISCSSIIETAVNSSFVVFIPDQKDFPVRSCTVPLTAGDVSALATHLQIQLGQASATWAAGPAVFPSSHLWIFVAIIVADHIPQLRPPNIWTTLWTKLLLFFWCHSFSESSSLWLGPPLLLPAYFGVVFLVCSWKGPQRRDNRAPAGIMSPQREKKRSWGWESYRNVDDGLTLKWSEMILSHTFYPPGWNFPSDTHAQKAVKLKYKHTHTQGAPTHKEAKLVINIIVLLRHICCRSIHVYLPFAVCGQVRSHRQTFANVTWIWTETLLLGNKSQTVYMPLLHSPPKSKRRISHQDSFPF